MYLSVLLVALLWSLIEVHSLTGPYVSFMGQNLSNHSYVDLSLVGNVSSNALKCNSGNQGPQHRRGDWYFPNKTKLQLSGGGKNIYIYRHSRRVDLHRRHNALSPSGIYHCEITGTDDFLVHLYVGLYPTSGGDITISDDMTLTVDSDLNGASPQFTLTCISTGGPATTVTWTRDGLDVTEGTTKTVLDDPETAQYNHTLTVTGRLPGLYTCTVANNKPSTNSASITVQGVISGDMTLTVDSDLNGPSPQFTLTCISTGGPATTFTWTRDSVTVTEGTETVLDDPETSQYTHTLTVTGRLPGLYRCSLTNNKLDNSSAMFMVQVAPVPLHVVVSATNNKIRVEWNASGEDGVVTGYLVYYHHPTNQTIVNVTDGLYDNFTENNTSQRVYTVSVQALSQHFPSEVIGPFTVRVPSNIVNLSLDMDNDMLVVSWDPPVQPNDFTWNYTLIIAHNNGSELYRDELSMNDTHVLINEELVDSCGVVRVNVSVFATNGRGMGGVVSQLAYYKEDGEYSQVSSSSSHGEKLESSGALLESRTPQVTVTATTGTGSRPSSNISTVVLAVAAGDAAGDVSGDVSGGISGVTASIVAEVIVVVILIIVFVVLFISWRRSVRVKAKLAARQQMRVEQVEDDDYCFDGLVIGRIRSDIPQADFPAHVSELHSDRDKILELEYKSLNKLRQPACEAGCLPCNLSHNRFNSIYPYDETRVCLKGDPDVEGSDYINASFIDGYPNKKHAYIASQGPNEVSVVRFWQMIWEYQLPTIVMLTQCIENDKMKCVHYWPDQINKTTTIGSEFTLTTTSFKPSAEYQISKIKLQSSSEPEHELCVTHMHYTVWPDHGVSANNMSVISFIWRVRREHPASLEQPLLVHCSAGIGRTGTFILMDMVMQQMKTEGTLSVYNHLKNIRKQRMKMVQTQAQYAFVHDALSELVVCGYTEIAVSDLRVKMNQLQKHVAEDMTGYQKQFQTLEMISGQYKNLCQEAKAVFNASKNRFSDKLPNETGRVKLGKQGSDYINASFIDGYKQQRAYIATQGPLSDTVKDLWRMIWEYNCSCIVMLCDLTENDKASCCCFWPQGPGGVATGEEVYGRLRVCLTKVECIGDITKRKLEVTQVEEKSEEQREVTLLQLSGWSLQKLPSPQVVLTLVDQLSKAQRSSPNKQIVIMCSDGVGRSGTFICLHSQLERLKTEGVVDFFQAIKSARIQRAGLVPDAVHYAFCHEVVASYVDSFETYSNFKNMA